MDNLYASLAGVSWENALLLALIFLLAGIVKGVIGLGLPTVAVGLLGLIMPPMEAASLIIVPSLATNIWQLAIGTNLIALLRRLWPMLAGICAGTWLGLHLLAGADIQNATTGLGAALVLYALAGLASLRLSLPPRAQAWLAMPAGGATGLITAATGVFVIPAVPYLQAINLNKDELIQAMGLAFTVSTLALAAGLAQTELFRPSVVGSSVMALLPALGGMYVGQLVRSRVRPAMFRTCFFTGLLVLGAHLAIGAELQ
jgi:uncharacterized membrane protein YfcA